MTELEAKVADLEVRVASLERQMGTAQKVPPRGASGIGNAPPVGERASERPWAQDERTTRG